MFTKPAPRLSVRSGPTCTPSTVCTSIRAFRAVLSKSASACTSRSAECSSVWRSSAFQPSAPPASGAHWLRKRSRSVIFAPSSGVAATVPSSWSGTRAFASTLTRPSPLKSNREKSPSCATQLPMSAPRYTQASRLPSFFGWSAAPSRWIRSADGHARVARPVEALLQPRVPEPAEVAQLDVPVALRLRAVVGERRVGRLARGAVHDPPVAVARHVVHIRQPLRRVVPGEERRVEVETRRGVDDGLARVDRRQRQLAPNRVHDLHRDRGVAGRGRVVEPEELRRAGRDPVQVRRRREARL